MVPNEWARTQVSTEADIVFCLAGFFFCYSLAVLIFSLCSGQGGIVKAVWNITHPDPYLPSGSCQLCAHAMHIHTKKAYTHVLRERAIGF